MVQIFKDTYEDLTPASFEQLIDDLAAGRKVKVGPQIDRHQAAPEGGPTTLIEPSLYEGNRTFTRVEAPPPPPPAAPGAAAGTPSGATVPPGTPAPAATAPKPGEIRPPTPASVVTEAQKLAAEKSAQAKGHVVPDKAQTETNITRATPEEVKETLGVTSADEANKTKK
jgi:NADH-quinone oxidoreductase subunit E